MSYSVRRSLVAVAAACTLGLLAVVPFTLASDVRRPVAPPMAARSVIVVHDAVPVPDSVRASGIDWLNAYLAAEALATKPAATIVIPGPAEVTGTIDPADMDWLERFAAASATAEQ
ncbi:hypothetical protein [Catenulispora pinisilvae]|uniref:hypothetical protein n=1 Tax=Catenulispora pinisilvae TaxID=2705253 RepID=UPI0018923C4B|nr:hypothetical protein [Catenulispora pinisilvae]